MKASERERERQRETERERIWCKRGALAPRLLPTLHLGVSEVTHSYQIKLENYRFNP